MPTQRLELEMKGLVTAPSQLSKAPGSLVVAQNVNFPAPGLVEKRKGLSAAAEEFDGACWAAINTKQLGSNVLFHTGDAAEAFTLQYGDGVTPPTTLSTPDSSLLDSPPEFRMKAAVSLKNHYLTSERAVARLESDYSLRFAGMPRSPGMDARQQGVAQLASGVSNWLANGSGVAYRFVWVTKDADGVELVSAPSGRWIVANVNTTNGHTGAALEPQLSVRLPFQCETTATNITTAWRLRAYRSLATVVASAQPNDEMQLCYDVAVTSTDITNGYVSFSDSCPEAALGAALYTNTVLGGESRSGLIPGDVQLGIAAANDRPPLARDVATFADCAVYADTRSLHRLTFSILATGAAGNVLKAGDQISIGSDVFEASASATPGTGKFRVETALGSVTLNLRQTAMNLVATINTYGTSGIVASYIGSDASPGTIGRILLEAVQSTNTGFTVGMVSGSGVPYLPQLTVDLNSSQDAWRNGLAISKPFQADAVPPVNYLRVGRNDAAIQRVVPLRDALFIFTEDAVYWMRGDAPSNFVIEAFDTTFRLLARDACVAVGDAIYAWGREGIARITDGGVEYIDLPIRNYVERVQRGLSAALTLESFGQRAFAVGYQAQRRVVFFFPTGSETGDYACSRALVFHIPMRVWSTYSYENLDTGVDNGKTAGCVRFEDELMLLGEWANGTGALSLLFIERRANTDADYTDTGTGKVSFNVFSQLTWEAVTPNPGMLCHWTELEVYFSTDSLNGYGLPTSATASLETELGGGQGAVLTPVVVQSRVMVSNECSMSSRMTVAIGHDAAEYVAFSGFALQYHPVSHFNAR